MLKLLLANVLLALVGTKVGCFNVDTKFPIIFSGPQRSYFGYSVALDAFQGLFVGAPRANNTNQPEVFEPGSLFSCPTDGGSCKEMELHGLNKGEFEVFIFKDRIWFGGTLAVGKTGNILACAHRYRIACDHDMCQFRNEFLTGACLHIHTRTGVVTHILNPLDHMLHMQDSGDMPRKVYENQEWLRHWVDGQLGMSAVFTRNNQRIFIGAPGVTEGKGNDCSFLASRHLAIISSQLEIEAYSYFGYSITTQYNNKYAGVIIGAPRDENFGKVYLRDFNNRDKYAKQILKGFQFGEYFGASVLGVDLNGDSFSDLLVGAPLYSVDTGCDEGKVYVFLGKLWEMEYFTELVGDRKTDARFGTALANIGDLNQDGCEDIAVGAPYEDGKGAVYIYMGSKTGIKNEYSQKIEASQINPALSGFGIHISGEEDVDGNGYPDIAVGSYLSSNVVLLRSLPVIEVSLDLFFNPSSIKTDFQRPSEEECSFESNELPCVHMDVYIKYTGKQVPASLNFLCSVIENDPNPRGFFVPYHHEDYDQRNLTVKVNTKTRFPFQFYLPPNFIMDRVTPIPISLSCDLTSLDMDTQNDTINKSYFSYPIVSPSSNLNITKLLPFQTDCGRNEVCYSDLVVTAELEGMTNGSVITLGNVTSVTLYVDVQNNGPGPAFLPELLIHITPEAPVISMDLCETGSEKQNGIKCELENPLAKDKVVSFQIKLDMTKLSPGSHGEYHTSEIVITMECTTNSIDVNPEDNVASVSLGVQTASDIGIRGFRSHSLILYHETEEMSSTIEHKYTVKNHGPSPLHSINVILQIPNVILSYQGRKEFLFFIGLQTDSQSDMTVPSACNSSHLDEMIRYENDSLTSNNVKKREASENRMQSFYHQPDSRRVKRSWRDEGENHVLSCDTKDIECVTIHCSSSPFTDLRKFAEVSVIFQIDFRVLKNHFKSWSQIELISTASLSNPDNGFIVLPDHPKISRVKTVFLDVRHSSKVVPHWLYFTSIIIGLMLLLQVVFILNKVGFFKRKGKMALNKLKQSFLEADIEEELLIDPSGNADLTEEIS